MLTRVQDVRLEAGLGNPLLDDPIAIFARNPVLGHQVPHLGHARLNLIFATLQDTQVCASTSVFLYLKVSLHRWHCSGLQQPVNETKTLSDQIGYRSSVWWIMCSFRELKWATSFPHTGQEKRPKCERSRALR